MKWNEYRDRISVQTRLASRNDFIASSVLACCHLDTTKKSVSFTDKALDPYNAVKSIIILPRIVIFFFMWGNVISLK